LRAIGLSLGCALLTAGCGGRPPATYVGDSEHFRLYVDRTLSPLPDAFAGENALAALETNWSDFATMLKMPNGKIMYYLYAANHISEACDGAHVGGCTKEEDMEIDAPLLPDAHELTHAYTYLRSPRRPIPFLAEGFAEALGCGEVPVASVPPGDWRGAVAGTQSDEVYARGGQLARQLIRRHGIDDFLRYYEQSPERRDPALFAANFESFWHVPLDDAWAELVTDVDPAASWDRKICPCSLPTLPLGGEVNAADADPARVPYWTVPTDLGDETIALTARAYSAAHIYDCAGQARPVSGKGLLARLDSTAGLYVPANVTASAIDRFAADSCADLVPYQLPADFLVSVPFLSVTLPTPPVGSRYYVAVELPAPAQVSGADAICSSCAFDEGDCQPLAPNAKVAVSGTFYARLRFDPTGDELQAGLTTRELGFVE